MKNLHGVRMTGSAVNEAICVATGRTDAYYEFGTKIWDVAAAIAIVREAGGVALDPSGAKLDLRVNNRRILFASSEELAKEIAETLDTEHPELPFKK